MKNLSPEIWSKCTYNFIAFSRRYSLNKLYIVWITLTGFFYNRVENSATHQIDKKSLRIRVDMNMCTDWYHQHKYRHFGMDYSNTHWYLKINKKLKLRELLMIMMQVG